MYIFVGYVEKPRGGYFYSHEDQKVFVSTNTIFLENDYMNNYKPRSKVVIEEIRNEKIHDSSSLSPSVEQ